MPRENSQEYIQTTVFLRPDQHEALREEAYRERRKMSAIIRDALDGRMTLTARAAGEGHPPTGSRGHSDPRPGRKPKHPI